MLRNSGLFSLLLYAACSFAQSTEVNHSLSDIPQVQLPGAPIVLNPLVIEQAFLTKEFDLFVKQGVPAEALRRALTFYLQNFNKPLVAKATDRLTMVSLRNNRFIGIADFTKPSDVKRFYLLDLNAGTVEKHYVSHGAKSGYRWAQFFSNEPDSNKTSLGFYLTGNTYESKAFESRAMKIFGIEASNFNAFARSIVIHQAPYASPQFIEKLSAWYKEKKVKFTPRLGRSFGCFALDPEVAQDIIEKLQGGALLYAYVRGGENQRQKYPAAQNVIRVNPALDTGIDTEEELLQRVVKPKNQINN